MADGDAKGVVKRIHMNVDLSPNMEDNRPLKISRVQSPEPETLSADTPEWAKIMYRSLNGRMTAFESNENDTIDFVADTATSAFANTGVNKLAITEIREQFNHLQNKFEDMKIENKTLREKLVSQECYSRRWQPSLSWVCGNRWWVAKWLWTAGERDTSQNWNRKLEKCTHF